jgi:hypothetical protein
MTPATRERSTTNASRCRSVVVFARAHAISSKVGVNTSASSRAETTRLDRG